MRLKAFTILELLLVMALGSILVLLVYSSLTELARFRALKRERHEVLQSMRELDFLLSQACYHSDSLMLESTRLVFYAKAKTYAEFDFDEEKVWLESTTRQRDFELNCRLEYVQDIEGFQVEMNQGPIEVLGYYALRKK